MINIVMMKWASTGWGRVPYTSAHVNNLVAGIDRNTNLKVRYHLITDDPEGVDGSVIVHPIWNDGVREKGGCYVRLELFHPRMRDMIGERFCSIDLDAVVMGDMNPILTRPEDFIIWKNGSSSLYCGSMFMMNAGCRSQVRDFFDPDRLVRRSSGKFNRSGGVHWYDPAVRKAGHILGSDQAVIAHVLGPGEATWTSRDGVMSFKNDILRHRAMIFDARIVFFHGKEDPSQKHLQDKYSWIQENWEKHDDIESKRERP